MVLNSWGKIHLVSKLYYFTNLDFPEIAGVPWDPSNSLPFVFFRSCEVASDFLTRYINGYYFGRNKTHLYRSKLLKY